MSNHWAAFENGRHEGGLNNIKLRYKVALSPSHSCPDLPGQGPMMFGDYIGKVETPIYLNGTNVSCSYLEAEERCSAYLLLLNKSPPKITKITWVQKFKRYFTV